MKEKNIKHIVAFSGGLASAVVAKIVADEHPKNTTLLYHSTNTEPPDNDRFRAEVSNYIGIPITEDSDGRNIWEIFTDTKFLGNSRIDPCSRILKRERTMKYAKKHQPCILYFGFTIEEKGRAQKVFARYLQKGIETRFPLIENKIKKEECEHRVVKCWKIARPQMYDWADHANCVPCVKGYKTYFGLVYLNDEQAWNKAVEAEKKFNNKILNYSEAGTLEEEKETCIEMAKKYLRKKKANEKQGSLFEFPCECSF